MKVKYNWELVYGDGKHFDKVSATLTKKEDIDFFDYLITLELIDNDGRFILNIIKNDKWNKLCELFENTQWYKEGEYIEQGITYMLKEHHYLTEDTTSEYSYTKVQNITRTEIDDSNPVNGFINRDKVVIEIDKEFLLKEFDNIQGHWLEITNKDEFLKSMAKYIAQEIKEGEVVESAIDIAIQDDCDFVKELEED